MFRSPGVDEPIVRLPREIAVCHHGIGLVRCPIGRGGGRNGGLFVVFLFPKFIGGLFEIAVIAGMTLAGTIPALYIRIGGAGRVLIVVAGVLLAFITLSPSLGDGKRPRSGLGACLLRLYIPQRFLD